MTVNSDRYVNMFQDDLHLGGICFQQDGTMAHSSTGSMAVLREHIPGRFILIMGDLMWPLVIMRVYVTRSTRFEDQYPGRNCQYNAWYADKSYSKRQKSVYSVCREWGCHLADLILKTM